MKKETADVSYRDKATNTNVSLGEIEVDVPETVDEAIELYGEEKLLAYSNRAYVIEKQASFRDANRPDKTKTQSNQSKFKQLSPEKQEELLRQAGLL
jgi:hypothetical protein